MIGNVGTMCTPHGPCLLVGAARFSGHVVHDPGGFALAVLLVAVGVDLKAGVSGVFYPLQRGFHVYFIAFHDQAPGVF